MVSKKVYIPSDMIGFYEKCGFVKNDELVNYGGDTDSIFVKKICNTSSVSFAGTFTSRERLIHT